MNFFLRKKTTPLVKIKKISEEFSVPNLLIKDESKNPSGTWKDRKSQEIIKSAKNEFVDKLVLITSGNAGFSLAQCSKGNNIRVNVVIDQNLSSSIKNALSNSLARVKEVDLNEKIFTPEELIASFRERPDEVIWDVTNGFHLAYEPIIKEIRRKDPDYIICPIGSGEAFVGLAEGIKKKNLRTKLIGIKPKSNPSVADKLYTSWTPYQKKIDSLVQEGSEVIEMSESEIESVFLKVKDLIDCEPSSAIVFGVFSKRKFKDTDKIIVINSGKGLL